MKVRLIELAEGADPGREIVIGQTDFLIGRGGDCDLRLTNGAVSRHHCTLHLGPGEVSVIDLGSANGTFLNGQNVRSRATLHSGDELRIGDCRFLINVGDQEWVKPGEATGADATAATYRVRRKASN